MSAVRELRPDTGTNIVLAVEANPALVLVDQPKLDEFYAAIEAKVRSHKPNLTTDKGRKAIASLARDVSTEKVKIDKAGLKLTEDMRKQIASVNEARKEIAAKFDTLRDEARQPLTDWENAEEVRKNARERDMQELGHIGIVGLNDTADDITERIVKLEAMEISKATFQEYTDTATARRDNALHTLRADLLRVRQQEEERAELAKLRALQAEREEQDAARKAAEDAAEAERIETARLEAARIEREEMEAEAEREEAARKEADAEKMRELAKASAEQAREIAEREAAAELQRREDEHAAELRRIQDEHDAAERKREQGEAERIAAKEAERKADERRAANNAHRSKIMKAAKLAIMKAAEIDEDTAKAIVAAIVAGTIPNVSIQF